VEPSPEDSEEGDEYRSFAVELGRVAKSFDMGQITDFLQPYLEKTE